MAVVVTVAKGYDLGYVWKNQGQREHQPENGVGVVPREAEGDGHTDKRIDNAAAELRKVIKETHTAQFAFYGIGVAAIHSLLEHSPRSGFRSGSAPLPST